MDLFVRKGRLGFYHEQSEHGLSDVEAVSPVVVRDPSVAFTHRIHEPHQHLQQTRTIHSL